MIQRRARCTNPVCPHPEQVRSVSSVHQSASVSTTLHTLLAPPTAPPPPKPPVLPPTTTMNALMWTCVSLVIFALAEGTTVQAFLASTTDKAALAALGVGIALAAGYALWSIVQQQIREHRARAEVRALYRRAVAGYPDTVRLWEDAVTRWYWLYYCDACGNVFDPDDTEQVFLPASAMATLLYRTALQ